MDDVTIRRYRDGLTDCEAWEVPDTGWAGWLEALAKFIPHALGRIGGDDPGRAYLELNLWPDSGRLCVFASDELGGDRNESTYLELSSRHIRALAQQADDEALDQRLWHAIAEQLKPASEAHRLLAASGPTRVVGYNYEPGEEPPRLDFLSGSSPGPADTP